MCPHVARALCLLSRGRHARRPARQPHRPRAVPSSVRRLGETSGARTVHWAKRPVRSRTAKTPARDPSVDDDLSTALCADVRRTDAADDGPGAMSDRCRVHCAATINCHQYMTVASSGPARPYVDAPRASSVHGWVGLMPRLSVGRWQ